MDGEADLEGRWGTDPTKETARARNEGERLSRAKKRCTVGSCGWLVGRRRRQCVVRVTEAEDLDRE